MSDLLQFVFVQHISWLVSVVSLTGMWYMGDKKWWAPWIGVGSQLLWLQFTFVTGQWGLLPAVLAYTYVHVRNGRNWYQTRYQGNG